MDQFPRLSSTSAVNFENWRKQVHNSIRVNEDWSETRKCSKILASIHGSAMTRINDSWEQLLLLTSVPDLMKRLESLIKSDNQFLLQYENLSRMSQRHRENIVDYASRFKQDANLILSLPKSLAEIAPPDPEPVDSNGLTAEQKTQIATLRSTVRAQKCIIEELHAKYKGVLDNIRLYIFTSGLQPHVKQAALQVRPLEMATIISNSTNIEMQENARERGSTDRTNRNNVRPQQFQNQHVSTRSNNSRPNNQFGRQLNTQANAAQRPPIPVCRRCNRAHHHAQPCAQHLRPSTHLANAQQQPRRNFCHNCRTYHTRNARCPVPQRLESTNTARTNHVAAGTSTNDCDETDQEYFEQMAKLDVLVVKSDARKQPVISVKLNGQLHDVIVDTGATHSMMSETFFTELTGKRILNKPCINDFNLVDASNSPMSALGYTRITLEHAQWRGTVHFLVIRELSVNVILGFSTMKYLKMKIDCGNGTVTIGGDICPFKVKSLPTQILMVRDRTDLQSETEETKTSDTLDATTQTGPIVAIVRAVTANNDSALDSDDDENTRESDFLGPWPLVRQPRTLQLPTVPFSQSHAQPFDLLTTVQNRSAAIRRTLDVRQHALTDQIHPAGAPDTSESDSSNQEFDFHSIAATSSHHPSESQEIDCDLPTISTQSTNYDTCSSMHPIVKLERIDVDASIRELAPVRLPDIKQVDQTACLLENEKSQVQSSSQTSSMQSRNALAELPQTAISPIASDNPELEDSFVSYDNMRQPFNGYWSSLPRIFVSINTADTIAILDTQCGYSLVQEQFWREHNPHWYSHGEPTAWASSTFEQRGLKIVTDAVIHLQISDWFITERVLIVSNLRPTCIIGWTTMANCEMLVSLGDNTLRIGRLKFLLEPPVSILGDSGTSSGSPCFVVDDSCQTLPRVMGIVNGYSMKILIDSGSQLTLISDRMWDKIATRPTINLEKPRYGEISGISGESLTCIADVNVALRIRGWSANINATVVRNLSMDFLLGIETLRQHAMSIDLAHNCLIVGQHMLPFYRRFLQGPTEGHSEDVFADAPTILPANHPTIVNAFMICKFPDGTKGTFEPDDAVFSSNQWYMKRSLARTDNGKIRIAITAKTRSKVNTDYFLGHFRAHEPSVPETIHRPVTTAISVTEIIDQLQKTQQVDLTNLSGLENESTQTLARTLYANRDVFSANARDLGCCLIGTHTIDTGNAKPCSKSPYRIAHSMRTEMDRQVKELLDDGLIAPSNSPWRSPALLVQKKADRDGVTSFRLVIDYRQLNSVTVPDLFPMCRVDDTISELGNSVIFTTIDLSAGFWQIRVEGSDQNKTQFVTTSGSFVWLVMPFGLRNAPATFQRTMNTILDLVPAKDDVTVIQKIKRGIRPRARSPGEQIEVSHILDQRLHRNPNGRNQLQYLIQFTDGDKEWVRESDMKCEELLAAWRRGRAEAHVTQTARKSRSGFGLNQLFLVLLMLFGFASAAPPHVSPLGELLQCGHGAQARVWTMGSAPNCSTTPIDGYHVVDHVTAVLFHKTEFSRSHHAVLCQRKQRKIVTRMSFLGDPITVSDGTTLQPITVKECRAYVHKMVNNELIKRSDSIYTENDSMIAEYSWCCHNNPQSHSYVEVIRGDVFVNFETNSLLTTLDFITTHCSYSDGFCEDDNRVLLWSPKPGQACSYKSSYRFVDAEVGRDSAGTTERIISREGQFVAFNWKSITVCDGTITLNYSSDGLYFQYFQIKTLLPAQSLQPVTNQTTGISDLTQQLYYLITRLRYDTRAAFHNTWLELCHQKEREYILFTQLAVENPTLAFRALMRRRDVTAQAAGDHYYVWSCSGVKHYTIRDTGSRCYRDLPIELADHSSAFVRLGTREIVRDSVPRDCHSGPHFVYTIDDETYTYGHGVWSQSTHTPKKLHWNTGPLIVSSDEILNCSITYHDGSTIATITTISTIVAKYAQLQEHVYSLVSESGFDATNIKQGVRDLGKCLRKSSNWFSQTMVQPIVTILMLIAICIITIQVLRRCRQHPTTLQLIQCVRQRTVGRGHPPVFDTDIPRPTTPVHNVMVEQGHEAEMTSYL